MEEIWKDIKGYEGLYQVSNLGRVKSLERTVRGCSNSTRVLNEKILKPQLKKNGYYYVSLWYDRKEYSETVHRLVAMAFLPNPDNLPFINHKSEIRTQNNVENLEWCSVQYNSVYGHAREKQQMALINNEKMSIPVLQFSKSGVLINEYPSMMEAERQTGVLSANISNCCVGRARVKTAGGFIWKFKNPPAA